MSQRKLRVGMVGGGGPANFFGAPHRRAILMDNSAELTAGALRSKPEESIASARELFFTRGYPDWQTMISDEAALPESRADRLRDDRHPQRRPLRPGRRRRRGRDRRPLREAADDHAGRGPAAPRRPSPRRTTPFVVAYTYTGFPMVMLARELVQRRRDRRGPQGRGVVSRRAGSPPSSRPRARSRPPGGSTRARPGPRAAAATSAPTPTSSSGSSPAGTATRLRGRLKTFVPGRALDDDFTVLAELDNGGIATIAASQITIGAQNDNGFRVSGTTGTLEWSITDHTVLKHYAGGQPLAALPPGGRVRLLPRLDQALLCASPPATPRGSTRPWPTCTGRSNGRSAAERGENVPDPVRAPRHRRRRRRHGVHRGRRRQLEPGRRLGRGPEDRVNGASRPGMANALSGPHALIASPHPLPRGRP